MAQIIQEIKIEVSKPNLIQAIVAKQYDSGSRFLKVTFVNDGDKIEILPTSTVTINAKRKDGESKSFAGEVNNDGTATVPLTYWMLELEGTVHCDVSVIDTEGRKLTTTTFTLAVERASCNSGDIAEDENYDVLIKLIEDVNKVKPDLEYNPESENAQSGIAIAQAMSGVNGIKYIREYVLAKDLDYGVYIIDEDYSGEVDFEDNVFNEFLYTTTVTSGAVIVSPYAGSKRFTVFCVEASAYQPIAFETIYGIGKYETDWTHVYTNKQYVDEQIASLQAQICEEKLFTFSFEELGEDILSKSIEKVDRWGVPCIKINFNLYTATKNADGTFTPYFDLPIEYMANPTLMADSNVKNIGDFKSFAIKSPLASNDFIHYESFRNMILFAGYAKDIDIRIISLLDNEKVGIGVILYLYYADAERRENYFSQVISPIFNSYTHFALKYENHKIPTVKPKKLI